MKARTLLFLATALHAVPALAVVDPPVASKADGRMRVIVYSRTNPVKLYAAPGASLRLQLGADEKVVRIVVSDQGTLSPDDEPAPAPTGVAAALASGGTAAGAAARGPASCDANLCRDVAGNFVYIKPLRELDPQPMFIQTERTLPDGRTEMVPYTFELLTRAGGQEAGTPHTAWDVTFTYPDREKAARAAEWRKRHDEQMAAARIAAREKAALTPPPPAAPELTANWRYGYKGSAAVAPDEAWDDGRTTFLRFNGNRRVPNVYRRLPDGKESVPTWTTEADATGATMRIAHTDAKWWIRDGDEAGCLFDLGPDPEGRTSATVASLAAPGANL